MLQSPAGKKALFKMTKGWQNQAQRLLPYMQSLKGSLTSTFGIFTDLKTFKGLSGFYSSQTHLKKKPG